MALISGFFTLCCHGNMYRYLGVMRHCIKSSYLRRVVLVLMIARTIKSKINYEMRQIKSSDESSYIQVFVKYINLVLQTAKYSK